ncbi:MAG TPA: CvpA family protein [Clostridia bacterium]|nr:CvpA family protein [Clostridia bacterium]
MSLFLDVVTVAVMGATILFSYRKGLVRSVIELAGYIAAAVAAYIFSVPLGNWLFSLFRPMLAGKFSAGISQALAQQSGGVGTGLNEIAKFVSKYGISTGNASAWSAGLKSGETALTGSVMNSVVDPFASGIGRILAFALIFALCMVLVRLVARASDVVFHIPVIRQVNGFGGAVVGVVKGFVIMFLISAIITVLIPVFALEKNPPITSQTVSSTIVYKYICQINPLTQLLLKK